MEYLSTAPSTSVLSALFESRIQICPYESLVQFSAIYESHAIHSLLVCLILDKTESAGCLLKTIETHDDPFHLTTSRSQWSLNVDADFEKSSCICSSVV